MDRLAQTLSTHDNSLVAVDVYCQSGHEGVVVICPGFFQSKDTPTFQKMSEAVASRYDVIAMDFRGHGRSSGFYTFSAKEGADLEAVLDWARVRYPRIGILGFSLGAAIAINALSHRRDGVRSLAVVSAPCAFEEIELKWWTPEAMRTGLDGLEPGAGCRPGSLWLKKERPVDHIARLSPVPVLFVHGTRDVIVGVEHSRRLYAAAGEPKRLEIIEGGSHAEALFRDEPERFVQLVNGWLSATLTTPA